MNEPVLLDPEDKDGNGLTEGINSPWRLWFTDAWTEFCNGAMSALLTSASNGAVVGAGTVTQVTLDNVVIMQNALVGMAVPLTVSGVKQFSAWHRTNPMPNPFASRFRKK